MKGRAQPNGYTEPSPACAPTGAEGAAAPSTEGIGLSIPGGRMAGFLDVGVGMPIGG